MTYDASDMLPDGMLGGADTELGNFIQGRDPGSGTHAADTCSEAARAVLSEIAGYPPEEPVFRVLSGASTSWGGSHSSSTWPTGSFNSGSSGFNPQDWCRKFLAGNGGCIYIDLDHTEVCLPEVTTARDFVTWWHAMLQIVRKAQHDANGRLQPGEKLQVLVNNTDGLGHSYGAHLNFLLTRETFDNLFTRKVHMMLMLVAYQVSSIVITGQGKVGSENDQPHVDFQLSQRADFFESLVGPQTTYRRPLVNTRDEALCGRRYVDPEAPANRLTRLHVIFYDANLCHIANYLKFGMMQIMLSMLAAEAVDHELILEDPLAAVIAWSHDPTLKQRQPLLNGKQYTAVELQKRFLEDAKRFVDSGRCPVPDSRNILELWEDTLQKLEAGDLDALRPRLDWVLKYTALDQAQMERRELNWDSPQMKFLDHLYGSLDGGLYWAFENSGIVERITTDEAINHATNEPPTDTRAWTRAMLLRRADPSEVDTVDWDMIRFRVKDNGGSGWPVFREIAMPDPRELTRSCMQPVIGAEASLATTLDRLGID